LGWLKSDNAWSIPALLKFSAGERVEFGFAMTGIVDGASGIKTTTGTPGVQGKVQLLNTSGGAAAAVIRADFPSGLSPSYSFYPVASLQTEPVQVDVTAGGSWSDTGTGYEGSFFYAVAVAPKLPGHVGVYGEVFGSVSKGVSAHSFDVGVSFAATPRIVFDTAYTRGLTNDAADWNIQAGMTITLLSLLNN
jgi:hypothetical protein